MKKNKKKNMMMSGDMRSVPDPKIVGGGSIFDK